MIPDGKSTVKISRGYIHDECCTIPRESQIIALQEQLEAYRRELRLIREHGRKGAGYLCACIADRVLEEG